MALSVTYDCTMLLGKLSVLFLLSRIFTLESKLMKYGIITIGIWTVLWFIAGVLYVFLHCRPLSTNWGKPHQCLPNFYESVIFGVLNVVSDLAILLLPQPVIWKLNLPTGKRLALSLVFLVGVL